MENRLVHGKLLKLEGHKNDYQWQINKKYILLSEENSGFSQEFTNKNVIDFLIDALKNIS